jgi:hypothetical protein
LASCAKIVDAVEKLGLIAVWRRDSVYLCASDSDLFRRVFELSVFEGSDLIAH